MVVMSELKTPDAISLHIGGKIKQRRKQQGLSLKKLAASTGLTYQQIQKYEQGRNRVSAPVLYTLSKMLDIPITYFFDGLDSQTSGLLEQLAEIDRGEEMLKSFLDLKNPHARQSVITMVKALHENEKALEINI